MRDRKKIYVEATNRYSVRWCLVAKTTHVDLCWTDRLSSCFQNNKGEYHFQITQNRSAE